MRGEDSDQAVEESHDNQSSFRPSRRAVLGGMAGLAVTTLSVGTVSAATPDLPTVEGPITGGSVTGGPQTAAPIDVANYGYIEEEYFISGDADTESNIGDSSSSWWSTSSPADYKTRMLVYRPQDQSQFNGNVLVEWFNVSTQADMAVAWPNAHEYLMRNGWAVALVSAQKVGVDDSSENLDLVTWDSDRYGDLTHPGDDYAVDIFAEAIHTLRTDQLGDDGSTDDSSGDCTWWSCDDSGGDSGSSDPDPLDGLSVQNVYATGQSQSSFYMTAYLNSAQPEYNNVDGFLPAAGLPDAPDNLVPVLWLNTESEASGSFSSDPPSDSGLFKYWEIAGASHVNVWLQEWSQAIRARDFEGGTANFDPATAGQYGEVADSTYGGCNNNYFPARYAYAAAIENLRAWVQDGVEAASAQRFDRSFDGSLQYDQDGNVLGGLRLPPIDVPVAQYDAAVSDCNLTGSTHRFDESTLSSLYASNDDYVSQLQAAADAAIQRGHLLQPEADDLLARASASSVGG